METELLLPGMLGTRMLGLMEQRGSVWNSALRLKYGLGGEKIHGKLIQPRISSLMPTFWLINTKCFQSACVTGLHCIVL